MTFWRIAAVALAAAALTACATPTGYGAAMKPGGYGYTETRIESDRYRVTFRGVGAPDVIDSFALQRAAELTLSQGRDWFVVDARALDRTGGARSPAVSIGAGGWSGGRTSVGIGTSVGIPLGGGAEENTARLDIRLGAGPKPSAPNAYDARSVLANLGARR